MNEKVSIMNYLGNDFSKSKLGFVQLSKELHFTVGFEKTSSQ